MALAQQDEAATSLLREAHDTAETRASAAEELARETQLKLQQAREEQVVAGSKVAELEETVRELRSQIADVPHDSLEALKVRIDSWSVYGSRGLTVHAIPCHHLNSFMCSIHADPVRSLTEPALLHVTGPQAELDDARTELGTVHGRLQERCEEMERYTTDIGALQEEVQTLQSQALERQRRFAAVQTSFKQRLQHVEADAAAAQAAVEKSGSEAQAAMDRQAAMAAELQAALEARDSAIARTEAAESAHAAGLASSTATVAAMDELTRRLEQASAEADDARRSEAEARRRIAHLEEVVEELRADGARSVGVLEGQLSEAATKLEALRDHAAALEAERSQLLLQALRSEEDQPSTALNMAEPPQQGGLPPSLALDAGRRLEAAEMAAAAATRRATAAEAELTTVRDALKTAEQRTKELGWQIRMMADSVPGTDVGNDVRRTSQDGQSSRIASMLDVFGCAINYDRRAR